MIDYATDPRFELIYDKSVKIYALKTDYITELHKTREVEAHVQNIYSNAGATADYINKFCEELLKKIESDPKSDVLRQTMIAGLNELKYRTTVPLDAICGIRMGAIFTYLEGEPEEASGAWLDKKVRMALEDAELYDFFYQLGVISTPAYSTLLNSLNDPNYLATRQTMILSFNQPPAR